MTRFLSERGVESKFVGGLRVSTPEVIDAVLKVLAARSTTSWWRHLCSGSTGSRTQRNRRMSDGG